MKHKKSILLVLLSILLLVVGAGSYKLFFVNSNSTAENYLYSAIEKSLSSGSVTTVATSQGEQGTTVKTSDVSFADKPQISQTITTTNKEGATVSQVSTLATLQNLYFSAKEVLVPGSSRHVTLPDNLSQLWGSKKEEPSETLSTEVYAVIPIGGLTAEQAQTVVKDMRERDVYIVDESSVSYENGQIQFAVEAKLDPLSKAFQQYDKITGYINRPGLIEKAGFARLPNRKFRVSIDTKSSKVSRYEYTDSSYTLDFKPYQLAQPKALPTQTIPFADLQTQIKQYTDSH